MDDTIVVAYSFFWLWRLFFVAGRCCCLSLSTVAVGFLSWLSFLVGAVFCRCLLSLLVVVFYRAMEPFKPLALNNLSALVPDLTQGSDKEEKVSARGGSRPGKARNMNRQSVRLNYFLY